MNARLTLRGAFMALGISMLLNAAAYPAPAQANCMSFAQARQQGILSGVRLRPAGAVKNAVEARTGGAVAAFQICQPGPVYKLTVIRKNGNVVTVTEPALAR